MAGQTQVHPSTWAHFVAPHPLMWNELECRGVFEHESSGSAHHVPPGASKVAKGPRRQVLCAARAASSQMAQAQCLPPRLPVGHNGPAHATVSSSFQAR